MSISELSKEQITLADALWDNGAILLGDFHDFKHQKPGDPGSPYKASIRPPHVTQEGIRNIGNAFYNAVSASYPEYVSPFNIDHIIGLPNVGDELADTFKRRSGISQIKIRKEVLPDGQRRLTYEMSDNPSMHARILGLDDVVNRGFSKMEYFDVMTAHRIDLVKFFVILDREEGGLEQLQGFGFPILAILKARRLFTYYFQNSLLTDGQYNEVMEFIESERSKLHLL